MKARQFEIWIADLLNKHRASSIICPITTKVQKGSEILRVHLKKGSCDLNDSCDIMIDQVRAIDNKRLIKKVGTDSQEISERIKENLKIVLDLE